MSAICARLSKGKVGVQRGRKTAGCPSFLPLAVGTASPPAVGTANPPRRGYGVIPPRRAPRRSRRPQTANPPAEVQRKTSRPERANTLTQFARPGQPVQKRSRPLGANTLTQFACPGFPVQEKEPPRQGEHANAVRAPRSAGAGKKSRPVRGEHANAVRAPGFPVQEKGEDAKSNGETAANFVYCYKIAQNRSVLLEMTGAKC